MANLKTYPLDLSGTLPGNKITGEIRNITKDADRVFIPTGGPFYTKSLRIFAGTTLLQPVRDYTALELNRDGTVDSGKEVCNVLFIKNPALQFRLEYQVIGGEYSDLTNELIDLINATPINKLNVLSWGSILNKPTTFPPSAHKHYPYEWRGHTQVIHLLEQIRQVVIAGDVAGIGSIYDYIENNIKNIVADYIDKNGLFYIDKTPTPNGNVILRGKGTQSDPLGVDLEALFNELDTRYFQNVINPLSRVGAISDSFLPISAGFFNSAAPLNMAVSMAAVGNVERNGDLLMLTPATNGEIIRYVYGYVRGWANEANITRYRATNQQYRPPGLAENEEIMDLFGYHEQSMLGSIYTLNADGTATFKESIIIWLNGTLAAENHVLVRLGRSLITALNENYPSQHYSYSPFVAKMRRGEQFLFFYKNNSGVDVFRFDETSKTFTRVVNWNGHLQQNIIDPTTAVTVDNVISTTEQHFVTGQERCRPFAWWEGEKEHPGELYLIDTTRRDNGKLTSIDHGNPGTNRRRMGLRVVGDTVKVMCNITYQTWLNNPGYSGGARDKLGFSLEITPLSTVPAYKWIRHKREGDNWGNVGYIALHSQDRIQQDIYETSTYMSCPQDLFSQWEWWENLQSRTWLILNDGRAIVWGHPNSYGFDTYMTSRQYGTTRNVNNDIERMFNMYFHTKYSCHQSLGGLRSDYIGSRGINFPSPTVNDVKSVAIMLGDGTLLLNPNSANPRGGGHGVTRYTAYRPSSRVIDYKTTSNGLLQGFDTSYDRIEIAGSNNLYPFVSARMADGSVKVGSLVFYSPQSGVWADQTCYANFTVDWGSRELVKREPYTFTLNGFNTIEDFLNSALNNGSGIMHKQWTLLVSPVDPAVGLLSTYVGRYDSTGSDQVYPVKLQWDSSSRLSGISINPTRILSNDWTTLGPIGVGDARNAWCRLQWVVEYSADWTKAFWAGKLANSSHHKSDTMARAEICTFMESRNAGTSVFSYLGSWGNQNTTSGYKTLTATPRGIGMMTDDVGYGVFRALMPMTSINFVPGNSIFKDEKPFIYVTPRPPSNFSLAITDVIDVQIGGVYGQIQPVTYDLTDPIVSDVIDPKNKTIYLYVTLELGKPKLNFRENPMAESIYTTYIGKCVTDQYGIMEADISPVTRIGNYRPSATPRGSSFSVSSGTADSERLLNWDANVFSSEGIGDISNIPETLVGAAGTYEYLLSPGDGFEFTLLGGGGGGGGSVYTGGSMDAVHGKNGEASKIYVNGELVFTANGGTRGTGGWWGNGSHMSPGDAGIGGYSELASADYQIVISKIVFKPGFNGKNQISDHSGGGVWLNLGPYQAGVGGSGGNGIGDNGNSNGGGGGGAGYIAARLKNRTNSSAQIRVVIGAGGAGGTGSRTGVKGKDGAILFTKSN